MELILATTVESTIVIQVACPLFVNDQAIEFRLSVVMFTWADYYTIVMFPIKKSPVDLPSLIRHSRLTDD